MEATATELTLSERGFRSISVTQPSNRPSPDIVAIADDGSIWLMRTWAGRKWEQLPNLPPYYIDEHGVPVDAPQAQAPLLKLASTIQNLILSLRFKKQ